MASEQRGFVFAVSFITIFWLMLSGIPADFQGLELEADIITPIDPVLLSGFEDYANYTESDFVGWPIPDYEYDNMGGYDWQAIYASDNHFFLTRKVKFYGLWLGAKLFADFISEDGTNNGQSLSWTEIENDAVDGAHRYNLILENGDSAGGFVVFWNTTLYSDPNDAWDNDVFYIIHGVGISETATTNIGNLIIGLLFLQIPDVPVLVNAFIVIPIWANIIYILWFIIINMIPFLGGG